MVKIFKFWMMVMRWVKKNNNYERRKLLNRFCELYGFAIRRIRIYYSKSRTERKRRIESRELWISKNLYSLYRKRNHVWSISALCRVIFNLYSILILCTVCNINDLMCESQKPVISHVSSVVIWLFYFLHQVDKKTSYEYCSYSTPQYFRNICHAELG